LRRDTDAHHDEILRQASLEHVRLLVEKNRQDTGLDGPPVAPRRIGSIGIVGAGMMGTAIAAVHLKHDLPVRISDTDETMLAGAGDKIVSELSGETSEAKTRGLVDRLVSPVADETDLAGCDLVLESIVEDVYLKRQLYGRLQPRLPGQTILATNTSTIPIERLADGLADPARFCGFHFCHPVQQRPLVEIIRGPATSDLTIATMFAHAKAVGKMPIVVDDGPGFLINRLLLPYLGEALELLLEGVDIKDIEAAATGFGMAKGPLGFLDEIGLDTTLKGGLVLAAAFPERTVASPLLVAMVKAGLLGVKSGAGFFTYDRTTDDIQAEKTLDAAAVQLIAQWAYSPQKQMPQKRSPGEITTRLFLPMVLEATRILAEQKVRHPRDIDLGVLFGLGFPSQRGGLLWWADTLGAGRIIEMLRSLERLGPRAEATPLLIEMARDDTRFYDPPTHRGVGLA